MASEPERVLHDFKPNSGVGVGLMGLATLIAVATGVGLAEPNAVGAQTALVCCYLGLLVYISLLRPRVKATSTALLLRNLLSTWRLPLRRIDTVMVRQQLFVWIGDRRYGCVGLGRTARSMMRSRGRKGGALAFLGMGAEVTGGRSLGPTLEGADYLTFVERRIEELGSEAARDHPDVDFTPIREWSRPLLVAVSGGLVVVVVALVVL